MSINNNIHIEGYWPDSEKLGKGYIFVQGDDNKKSFIRTEISVKDSYRAKDSNEIKFTRVHVKAFSNTAEYLNRLQPGDYVGIEGELRRDDPYEDKDGNTVYPDLYIAVRNAQRYSSKAARDLDYKNSGADTAAKPAATNVFAKKASSNPFARK